MLTNFPHQAFLGQNAIDLLERKTFELYSHHYGHPDAETYCYHLAD